MTKVDDESTFQDIALRLSRHRSFIPNNFNPVRSYIIRVPLTQPLLISGISNSFFAPTPPAEYLLYILAIAHCNGSPGIDQR